MLVINARIDHLKQVFTYQIHGISLNWTAQTKIASTKAQQTLGVIRRNLNKCSTHIKAVAYTSLVSPILEYASAAWDPHSQNNIKPLERIQRQAARFCTNNYSREPGSVTKLSQELGWETLQTRIKCKRIITLNKMEHNSIAIWINISCTIPVSHENITVSFFKLDTRPTHYEIVFSPTTAKEWKALPVPSDIISGNGLPVWPQKQKNIIMFITIISMIILVWK